MTRSILVLLVILFVVSACTPSYTADIIDNSLKRLGVVGHFEINRWHHYLMAQDSRLAVVAHSESPAHGALLARAIESSFSRFYADVTVLDAIGGDDLIARAKGHDFLLRATLLFTEPALNLDSEDQGYKNIRILISVVDVNSTKLVDKVLLSSTQSYLSFVSGRFDNLLDAPLNALAEELSGVQ